MAIFDSQDKNHKIPIGPIKVDEPLILNVNLENGLEPHDVKCFLDRQGKLPVSLTIDLEMQKELADCKVFSTTILMNEPATYKYYFKFMAGTKEYFLRRKEGSFDAVLSDKLEYESWNLTIYNPISTHPAMNNGIMYQIFPDRFAKGKTDIKLPNDRIYRDWGTLPYWDQEKVAKDFFGGNFAGIEEKIDYLKKLHVNVLYSNPVCLASSNHRYDAINYTTVDPILGTDEDFKHLLKKLHEAGIIYIQDAVLNHVGSDSIYFNKYGRSGNDGAYNNENSKYRDWFYFNKDNPEKYDCWWDFDTMPKLNYSSHSLVDYILGEKGVLAKWYEWGVDGLRLDVADELPNEILRDIYHLSKFKKGKDTIVIPEVWEDASHKWAYGHLMEYCLGEQATSVMNYPIRDTLLPYIRYGDTFAHKFKSTCEEIFKENYPREIAYSLMNFISTHDTERAITKLAGPEVNENNREWQAENNTLSSEDYILGKQRLMLAYLVIFLLPGIPSIYYGDEVGMQGMKDPFNRACFPKNKKDQDKDLLNYFVDLCDFRYNEREFIKDADFNILVCEDRFLIFERIKNDRAIKACFNFSKIEKNIMYLFKTKEDGKMLKNHAKLVFSTNQKNVKNNTYLDKLDNFNLPPLSAIVYEVKKEENKEK